MSGRKEPQGYALLDWLARIKGDWHHVPSPEGLFILRQVDSPRMSNQNERPVLYGELRYEGELADYLTIISDSRWNGHLYVFDDDSCRTVSFWNGDVYEATSATNAERQGQLAVRFGFIQRDQLDRILVRDTSENCTGYEPITSEMLTPHGVHSQFKEQAEEVFFNLLRTGNGQFIFYRKDKRPPQKTSCLLQTKKLLMVGLQRVDEMNFFLKKIPSSRAVLERVSRENARYFIAERERTILSLINGRRTLEAITRESQYNEFETTKSVYKLLQGGLIRIKNRDRLGKKSRVTTQAELSEIIALYNGVFSLFIHEAKLQDRTEELLAAVRSFIEANNYYSDLFIGVYIKRDGKLNTDRIVTNTMKSAVKDKIKLLYQGLNEFLFFLTFITGETLDTKTEVKLHDHLCEISECADNSGLFIANSL